MGFLRRKKRRKSYEPIDKSKLEFGTEPRVEDKPYLRSFNGRPCEVCGSTETTVACHIRALSNGGMGLKPSDDLVLALCYLHHQEQAQNEPRFYRRHFNMSVRETHAFSRRNYGVWKNG